MHWRVGYYNGITRDKWMKYGSDNPNDNHGWGSKDENWVWIDDKNFEYYMFLDKELHPKIDYETIDKLSNGYVWAVVPVNEIVKQNKQG
jgi:hypothetical protein